MHPLVISTTGRKIDTEVEGIQEAWTRRARTMATSSKATHITRSEERRLRRTSASTQAAVKMLPKEEQTRDKEVPLQRNREKKVSLKDEKVEEIPRRQLRDTTRKISASTQVAVKMLPKEEKTRDKEVPPQRNRGKKVSLKDKVDDIPRKQPRDTTKKTLASTPGEVKMSPKEKGARDKVVPPRCDRGKKVLVSQGNAEDIPRTKPRDTAQKISTSTQSAVKMLSKEEGTQDKAVSPRCDSGKRVLASQGTVDEIPRKQPRDTTQRILASTPGAVKMSPKEEGARDKVVPPRRQRGKKVLASQGTAEEIPRTKPRDTAEDILASTPVAVKMSPKEEGARDKAVSPRRDSGKKVLASQGNVEEIPRTQPRDTTQGTAEEIPRTQSRDTTEKDILASTPVAVKMSPKEEGAQDKVVPPRRQCGKKVLASQGIAEEIPRTQLRDTARKTSASTQEGVKMLPKEKGARNKVVSPPLQWKKALSQEEEATKVPRSQPEDIATDLAADAQECKIDPRNVCTRPAEEVSDRKPRVVLPPRCFKRTEALIAGHEDAYPTDRTEERRYLVKVDPETHQPSTELAGSDQQEDDRMDRIVVAGDNNLKGGVIPHHDTPKQENPGISNRQDAKQFVKGRAAEERPLKPAKIPITREQIPITTEQRFRFLTAAMDLLIQWLTVGRDTPGQETMNPQMRHEFPGFGPPRKAITARRTRFMLQWTREQRQATKILVRNLWPSTRTKRPCEEVTRGSPPRTDWRTKKSPVPKETARLANLEEIGTKKSPVPKKAARLADLEEVRRDTAQKVKTKKSPVPKEAARLADLEEVRRNTLRQTNKAQKVKTKKSPVPKEVARLADLEEIRNDTLRQTDTAQKVMKIGHQGNTRFKPYDKGDLEWVVGTNPETIYPTAKLGPQQGLIEVLKQLSNAVDRMEILRQGKDHNVFQINLTVPDMETELHGPNFTQLMRRTINTKSKRRSTRREDARHGRRTLQVRTWESRQMNTWTNSNEAEFRESNDKRATSPTRESITQLICFSPSTIYSLLLRTMSTVPTSTVTHTAPSPPPPPPSVVSAPDNTPEPLSPQLARRSLPIREDEEESAPQSIRQSLLTREDKEESKVNDDRAEEQLTELTTPVGCKKEDHVGSQCPMKRTQESCKKCGKVGHSGKKCPKKAPEGDATAPTVESGEIRSNQDTNTATVTPGRTTTMSTHTGPMVASRQSHGIFAPERGVVL
jgi:hypothetical protein